MNNFWKFITWNGQYDTVWHRYDICERIWSLLDCTTMEEKQEQTREREREKFLENASKKSISQA